MAEPDLDDQASHHLRRTLRLRDLVLTQILCVVGSSWVGVAAGLGKAQALTWAGAMLVFYLPMSLSVIALNRMMPLEGGLYMWAHQSFGELAGFLTAWNLWVYGTAVTASILYAIPTELAYLIGPAARQLPENRALSLLLVAVTTGAITIAALRGLAAGRWIHNIGGAAILTVYLTLIVLPWLAPGSHVGDTPFSWTLPPLNMRSFALTGQMLFGALCGLEYIAILAGESKHPAKTIGQSVWLSSPVICAMFILGTGSVVSFVPTERIDFIAPIPQTFRFALGQSGIGSACATIAIALVLMRLVGAASFLFTGVTRLPLAAGWNDLVPKWFTQLHPHWRTPVPSILCTALLVLLFSAMATLGVHAQEAFQVLSNASLTHYQLTYLVMFAIPITGAAAVRRALPAHLKWTSAAGFTATVFSLLISAYPFVSVVNAPLYAAKILGTVLASNLLGWSFYKARKRNMR